jgi:hypothetical protein
LDTGISAKNKIQVTLTMAIPVLRYSFGIINWHQEEIQELDRKSRRIITIQRQHHP